MVSIIELKAYQDKLEKHHRTIEAFTKKFDPIFTEDETDIQETLPPDADLKYWWSVVELDIGTVLLAGWHVCNRIGYVQCRKPWDDPQLCFEYRTYDPEAEAIRNHIDLMLKQFHKFVRLGMRYDHALQNWLNETQNSCNWHNEVSIEKYSRVCTRVNQRMTHVVAVMSSLLEPVKSMISERDVMNFTAVELEILMYYQKIIETRSEKSLNLWRHELFRFKVAAFAMVIPY